MDVISSPSQPDVSVLMAVYNGQRYLEAALRSMMDQSLRNIEIIVVDDCSTDNSPAILQRLAAEDPRIRIITAPQNLRLAGALNLGLEHARAPLVARMDDDDISLPRRLEVQKRYLDAHPGVTLLGASIDWIDAQGDILRRSVRRRDTFAIRWMARFYLNLSHPSFMFRPALPDGSPVRYDPEVPLAQDHELVCRLLLEGAEMACLPDVLLQYRSHEKSASQARRAVQIATSRDVATDFQRADLPPELYAALKPLRDAYFAEPITEEGIAGCFRAARAMLKYDMATHPRRRTWLYRQSAQLIAWSLQRAGVSKPQIIKGFLRHGGMLLPALGMRFCETADLLPSALHSDPEIA